MIPGGWCSGAAAQGPDQQVYLLDPGNHLIEFGSALPNAVET